MSSQRSIDTQIAPPSSMDDSKLYIAGWTIEKKKLTPGKNRTVARAFGGFQISFLGGNMTPTQTTNDCEYALTTNEVWHLAAVSPETHTQQRGA